MQDALWPLCSSLAGWSPDTFIKQTPFLWDLLGTFAEESQWGVVGTTAGCCPLPLVKLFLCRAAPGHSTPLSQRPSHQCQLLRHMFFYNTFSILFIFCPNPKLVNFTRWQSGPWTLCLSELQSTTQQRSQHHPCVVTITMLYTVDINNIFQHWYSSHLWLHDSHSTFETKSRC